MDTPQWLDAYPALKEIEDSGWRRLRASAREVTLPSGTTLFRDGDQCSKYLLVTEGSIRVQKVTESGREILLYRVEPGETCILTTACLLGSEAYPAEGITESEVHAITLPMEAFNRALGESEAFRRFVFAVYSRRVTDLILLVQEVAFGRMDRRLAQCLLQRGADSGRILATHQELAAELGTAREVISRLLKEFERQAWVRLSRGQIELSNPEALRQSARSEPE